MRLFSTRTPKINHRNAFPTCFISFHWKCEHFSFIPSFCFVLTSDFRVSFFFSLSLFCLLIHFFSRCENKYGKKNCRRARSCLLLRFMVAKLFPSFWIRKTFFVVFILFKCMSMWVCVCVCVVAMELNVQRCLLLMPACRYVCTWPKKKKLEMNILWIVLVGQRFYDAKSVMIVVFFNTYLRNIRT